MSSNCVLFRVFRFCAFCNYRGTADTSPAFANWAEEWRQRRRLGEVEEEEEGGGRGVVGGRARQREVQREGRHAQP